MKITNNPSQEYISVDAMPTVGYGADKEVHGTTVAQPGAAVPEKMERRRKELEDATEKIQKAAQIFETRVEFKIHDKTHRLMVQVIDSQTKEVLTAVPPEKILDMVADLENMIGLIVDKKV